ncbi:MAG: carboxynorspermidine decarboxylase [Gammaproteobacteria bacterium]|nr:carboxynorspermidine decarboxylase [Gammaproteobacteria bacterium]
MLNVLTLLSRVRNDCGCRILFSVKAFSFIDVLRLISPCVDGFAASSLFEATLCKEILGTSGTVHVTTPGLQERDLRALIDECDYISFNSIPQWLRHRQHATGRAFCGLRVNPKLSFVADERYDPCRPHSKLGAPIDELAELADCRRGALTGITGLHIHNNCEAQSFEPLVQTVRHLYDRLGRILADIHWLNLGGGYLFDRYGDLEGLVQVVDFVKCKSPVEVFFEPGKAIVKNAGYLVASVVDLFENDGKSIAILDTTVNHLPEVFEYQYRPQILQNLPQGKFSYLLAGATCLSGDIFGDYQCDHELTVGSRIIFKEVGAYSLVKAHMFNGVNLPAVYAYSPDAKFSLRRQFTYHDYRSRWMGGTRFTDGDGSDRPCNSRPLIIEQD